MPTADSSWAFRLLLDHLVRLFEIGFLGVLTAGCVCCVSFGWYFAVVERLDPLGLFVGGLFQ